MHKWLACLASNHRLCHLSMSSTPASACVDSLPNMTLAVKGHQTLTLTFYNSKLFLVLLEKESENKRPSLLLQKHVAYDSCQQQI